MAERLELDLTAVRTPDELQQLLFEAFRLPGWYGFNWNAFRDSITDPEQSILPTALVVRGWDTLAARLPDDARYLREDLEEAVASRPGCRLEWAEPDSVLSRGLF
jgi:ribonuclease inhibitor